MRKNTQLRHGRRIHQTNPFLSGVNLATRTRRITNKRGDMMLVNAQTGEIQAPVAGFWEAKEVDEGKFVKLFVNGVRALKELTSAGTKVFELLYLQMSHTIGKDQVYMSFQLVDQAITPMSEATYMRGMQELVSKGFLAATPAIGVYWLNPDYVFNGDRLAFVKEYRKSSADSPSLPFPAFSDDEK